MMPPSFYCKPRWIKAEGRSTGNSLAPPTQVAFMNNQSKMCFSEQHCGIRRVFYLLSHLIIVLHQRSLELYRPLGDQGVAVVAEVIHCAARLETLQLLLAGGADGRNVNVSLALATGLLLAAGIQFSLA
jgi:hypothetical protein